MNKTIESIISVGDVNTPVSVTFIPGQGGENILQLQLNGNPFDVYITILNLIEALTEEGIRVKEENKLLTKDFSCIDKSYRVEFMRWQKYLKYRIIELAKVISKKKRQVQFLMNKFLLTQREAEGIYQEILEVKKNNDNRSI